MAGSCEGRARLKRKLVDKNRTRCPISEPYWLVCISLSAPWPRTPTPTPHPPRSRQLFCRGAFCRGAFCRGAMNTEKFEGEGWRTVWIAIAGVLAITLTWNVLMLSLNGISYCVNMKIERFAGHHEAREALVL